MSVRKIEITEEKLKIGQVTYYEGDVKSLPKAEADQYIAAGWAKCCETGEQGDRVPGSKPIEVQNTAQTIG